MLDEGGSAEASKEATPRYVRGFLCRSVRGTPVEHVSSKTKEADKRRSKNDAKPRSRLWAAARRRAAIAMEKKLRGGFATPARPTAACPWRSMPRRFVELEVSMEAWIRSSPVDFSSTPPVEKRPVADASVGTLSDQHQPQRYV